MQGRLFNPDNPPQSFTKDEINTRLDVIKARLKEHQLERVKIHNVRKRGDEPGLTEL